MFKIGDEIIIIHMNEEPKYSGKRGIITKIDDEGQLHGNWGGLAINPSIDTFIKNNNKENL